jgi:hypothetical protein
MTASRMISMAAALALGGSFSLVGAEANACGNGTLLFEDKFETIDLAWNLAPQDPDRSNGPQGLVYNWNKPDYGYGPLNQSSLYATMRFVPYSLPKLRRAIALLLGYIFGPATRPISMTSRSI